MSRSKLKIGENKFACSIFRTVTRPIGLFFEIPSGLLVGIAIDDNHVDSLIFGSKCPRSSMDRTAVS